MASDGAVALRELDPNPDLVSSETRGRSPCHHIALYLKVSNTVDVKPQFPHMYNGLMTAPASLWPFWVLK